ncbi:hypothetical protein QFZ72_005410 [Bacillus sp. V2I10]|nr:hypothetical protein [Bacillus sp. V2I10]
MSENNQLRDVFDTIADPTRRRLIRLLAEAEEKPFHELTAQLHFAFQNWIRQFRIVANVKWQKSRAKEKVNVYRNLSRIQVFCYRALF